MSDAHNYRICFDFAAEDPRSAISYLIGIILDPASQDTLFDWVVIDTATKKEHRIRCSFNELEKEAAKKVKEFIRNV
jgi:hypothetical protein